MKNFMKFIFFNEIQWSILDQVKVRIKLDLN